MDKDIVESIEDIKTEEDALDQSLALVRVSLSLIKTLKESNKRIFIALVISLLVNLMTILGFLYYESQWEITDSVTTTTTTTQEVEGDSAETNNVDGNQYKDNAIHNQGGIE